MKTWKQKTDSRGYRLDFWGLKMVSMGWGIYVVLALWFFAFPEFVVAQGWYWGSPVTPGYDRSSVVEINGAVIQVDLSSRGGGSTLRIESDGEIITVTLGPGWYLKRQGADIQTGDKLAIKGSKMKTRDGKVYLTAASIKNMRTGQFLLLRDENSLPLWSSKRRLNK